MDITLLFVAGHILIVFAFFCIYHYTKSKSKIDKNILDFLALELPLLEDLHCDRCGEQVARQRARDHIIVGKKPYWSWTCPKCASSRLEAYNEED